jgi:hypothetical protein
MFDDIEDEGFRFLCIMIAAYIKSRSSYTDDELNVATRRCASVIDDHL